MVTDGDINELEQMLDGAADPPKERSTPATERRFPCAQCGAKVAFKPGEEALHCPYCGHDTPIERSDALIEELDYEAKLAELASSEPTDEHATVKCTSCGAEIDRPEHIDSFSCPYCDHNIVATVTSRKLIRPRSLLPFHVTREEARSSFKVWLKKLWFAPSALKKNMRLQSRLNGMYIPYWTYDSGTVTEYTGQRGEHYYVPVTYTTTQNGRTVTRTRMERRTRWYPASGTVARHFDDVLVAASQSLPRKHVEALEPWDLNNLTPYADEYLSGFTAESYQIELPAGFIMAQDIMAPTIHEDIRRDIGGDEQRVSTKHTHYHDITFKHILLPLWISSYRYKQKVYRFIVNARTGEVQGERPWSFWKIFFAVLGGLAVIGVIAAAIAASQGG
ncbi:MAG: primosomal protein N' (replication factor Y) - superfamily II helicase [Planctomycetota bacterium]